MGMPFLNSYGDGYYGDPSYYGDGSIPPNSWYPTTHSGAAVTEITALQLSAFYACVRLLADSIATLPWDTFRHADGIPVKVNPKPSLLQQPFNEITDFDWKHQMVVSMAIRGNFYGLVLERDRLEYPTQILPLHPDWVVLTRDPKSWKRIAYVNGTQIALEDLFHIKWFTLPGYDIGLSPLQVFRQTIGLGLAAEEFGGKWFRDGAAPSSTLQTDQTLSDDQIKQAQQQWIATQGGKRLPAVLSGGFKWSPVTITPEESQFLETRRMQVAEIARLFGIPPHMIGDVERSTSWGQGIEQQNMGYLTNTLVPWISRIESAFNQITPHGQNVRFNVDELLRADIETRFAAYQMGIDGGWMNPDEARAKEEMPPIPGGKGKQFRQPMNFAPLGYDPTTDVAPQAGPISIPTSPAKRPTKKKVPAKAPATTGA